MFVTDFNFFILMGLFIIIALKVIGRYIPYFINYRTKKNRTFQKECSSWLKIFLFFFIVRGFLIEPFYIPSSSMSPNLHTGDFVLINRLAFGVRTPVWRYKIFETSQPKRGEIAVFHFPLDTNTFYVKRIVGVPGDRIVYKNKILYVNDKAVTKSKVEGYFSGYPEEPSLAGLHLYNETQDKTTYSIMIEANRKLPAPKFFNLTVPENQYFVLGDNRDYSLDGRYWGFVPDKNLVGKPFFIWFNWGDRIDWARIFTIL